MVDGLSHDGEGIARPDGFTVFVPEAVPGDTVTAEVISVKPNYARALPLSIEKRSPDRVAPRCAHHRCCGGCPLQHLEYGAQLRFKEKLVRETLRRVGKIDAPVRPVLGMADPWRYRNKAQVPVASAEGRIISGFFEKRSHRVVDMQNCPLQHPAADRAVQTTRAAMEELRFPPYDEKTGRGLVRHMVVRVSHTLGEVLVTVVTNGPQLPGADELVRLLRVRVGNLAGIVQNINTRQDNVILGRDEITLWGRPYLVEKVGGLQFRVSTRSFFQVNTVQAETLYRQAESLAGLTGRETVYDLYCGTGTIGLYLAGKAGRVIGIEEVEAAVEDARLNARANGITNAQFMAGKAETLLPQLLESGPRPDVVVLDPPRKGCAATLLEALAQTAPARIVYISCNPATLARDLKILRERSYSVKEVQPVDMFPHTSHVECVIGMQRKDT